MAVMNVARSTKAFGETQPEFKSKNAETNTLGAHEKDKFNGEDIGTVLNKVADANYIDPAKKMRAAGNPNLDKDAFFKLMFAQLKHQDPTSPLKSHEMAAQLANFSSLEQMQNMNTTLTEMKNGQKPAEQFQALNLIGKSVGGDSAQLIRSKDDQDHDFRFNLPSDASDVTVKVKNAEGEVVRNYNLRALKAGENKITWNGENNDGRKMPAGEYTFESEAKTDSGTKLAIKTDFSGVISGVNFTPEGPVLMVGKQTLKLRDVRKIMEPQLQGPQLNDQKVKDVTDQDLKQDSAQVDNQSMSDGVPTKLMDQLGLSSGMMNKIAKETQK